ncbi:carboxylate--amine ligase [Haloferacaceae archaeon DSL9]
MAESFSDRASLLDALADARFDRPPALVSNAHITGLSVARALAAHDVPVIALDRNGDGVAWPSNAVDYAGEVTYPLDDADGFRDDVEAVVDAAGTEVVAFPCMDEWVHAYAGTEPDGVIRPFADYEGIDRVLDKSSLYRIAEALDVPYPETYRLDDADPDAAAEALGFPLVIKPALKREFEEAFGTNVVEVADREEYYDTLEAAEAEGVEVMAQERVDIARGRDCSLASYVPPGGGIEGALAIVGNPKVRFPLSFGTSCYVERVERPEIEARALSVLDATDYHGISEAEFVYDAAREEYVLLDINTRSWKWISMPVAAGANLPMAAYADATGVEYGSGELRDARWVYLRDYLSLLATDETFGDVLHPGDWASLASGSFEEDESTLTTGVYRPSDPAPVEQLVRTEFSTTEYYCSC